LYRLPPDLFDGRTRREKLSGKGRGTQTGEKKEKEKSGNTELNCKNRRCGPAGRAERDFIRAAGPKQRGSTQWERADENKPLGKKKGLVLGAKAAKPW